jgi:uncharacterized protein
MPQVLLIAAILLGLVMIPFGLPGTLVLFAAALCYHLVVPAAGIGLVTVIGVGVLMAIAEALEWVLTGRFTKRYGGSRRAAWGAIIGGMVGAIVGVPVPIVGSIVGAFAGAFVGAFVAEWSHAGDHGAAARVAWGALLGRVTAAATKVAIGLAMAVWMIAAAIL